MGIKKTPEFLPRIIAIDGYSSCGKSSFAKTIARLLGYTYVDSGAMYRAATWYAIQNQWIQDGKINKPLLIGHLDDLHIRFRMNPQTGENEILLNGRIIEKEIRNTPVSAFVSEVSALPEVRRKMVALQREMGSEGRIVMDGRDIGTVVFPEAELKIFMTADLPVRAQRRFDELLAKNIPVSLEEVQKNLAHRDHTDSNRKDSPLRKAEDAIVLDNTFLTPEQQLEWFTGWITHKKQP